MADEYIRKQDAVDALDRIFDNVPMELTTEILRLRRELRGLPSTDVAPVTHGGWMDAEIVDGDTAFPVQVCTVCSTFFPLAYTGGGHRFCPNCGAKMDSEKKE